MRVPGKDISGHLNRKQVKNSQLRKDIDEGDY